MMANTSPAGVLNWLARRSVGLSAASKSGFFNFANFNDDAPCFVELHSNSDYVQSVAAACSPL
eukprot:570013-Lingulodinium_polyedra.AAC.1